MNQPLCFSRLTNDLGSHTLPKVLSRLAEHSLGLNNLNIIYSESIQLIRDQTSEISFFDAVLERMGIKIKVDEDDLRRIPSDGPLVVVANHPYGGLDGLAMGALLARFRPDFKLLVNTLLGVFNEMEPWLLKFEIMQNDTSRKNLGAMLETARFLKNGNCLGVFPAGEVASLSLKNRHVVDPDWSLHPFSLARMTNARILPICFTGRNSNLFQLLGMIHPSLRTLMLGRELLNKCNKEFKIRVGEPISQSKIRSFTNDLELSEFARISVEALKRPEKSQFTFPYSFSFGKQSSREVPVIEPRSTGQLVREINALDSSRLYAEKGSFKVFCIRSDETPTIMSEISRLREITFRQVGEGTGKAYDSDPFDNWYYQLFAWDSDCQRIVGGYRLGVATEIIPRKGKEGMYATSEFSLRRGFYQALGNAVEVGRSFIIKEYQRRFSLLSLLWRGIGEFMNKRPDHFVLYGPVSISSSYSQLSRNLMVRFLSTKQWSESIAKRTKAKTPFRTKPLSPALRKWVKQEGRTLEDISAVVSSVEPDGKGVPVLVKHYLKLRGSFVGFAVDRSFGNSLDGLIVVDLRNMDDKQLLNYFGNEGLNRMIKARKERGEQTGTPFQTHESE